MAKKKTKKQQTTAPKKARIKKASPPAPVMVLPKVSEAKNWPLGQIKPYPKNPRTHPPTQVTLLAQMLLKWGPDQPIVVDEKGVILKGHGRLMAALEAELSTFPVVQRFDLTEDDKRAMRIADNQVALLSDWNHKLMQGQITSLSKSGYNMSLLAFNRTELAQWQAGVGIERDEDAPRANLLDLVNITIADPKHKVERDDHYVLTDRHHLFCTSVISGWKIYTPFLVPDALFCPYPGVFVPFSLKAKDHQFIMVQPDPYIAGHILDRWKEVHGAKAIKKMAGAE